MGTGFTPLYKIEKDGIDITDHFNDRTTMIRVDLDSGNGGGDSASITLDDRDWAIARPNVGDRLKIWLGYAEVGLSYLGNFELTVVEFVVDPVRSIQLTLNSTGQRDLYKSQTTTNFQGKSLDDIAQAMAAKAGLQAIVHPKVAQITIPYLNMTTSPQQLVAELGRQYGLVMKVVDDKLVATPRDGGDSATGQTAPILVLQPEHFGTVRVRHTERAAYSHVFAAWTDPKDYVTRFERSDLGSSGVTDLPFTIDRKFNSQAEAQAAAKSHAQTLQRSLGEADLQLAKGDPWIFDTQRILIRGMRDGINGSYVVDLASHTYVKEQGISTALKCRPDADAANYETLFSEADTPEKRAALFLVPGDGGLMGSLFNLGGVPAAAATAADIINGANPFGGH